MEKEGRTHKFVRLFFQFLIVMFYLFLLAVSAFLFKVAWDVMLIPAYGNGTYFQKEQL